MKKILQKIKCWLGKHEYRPIKDIDEFYDKICRTCDYYGGDCKAYWCYKSFGESKEICKHCGKVK